jgi:hypothetical protein
MSAVIEFYEAHPISGDAFHAMLAARPGLHERLKAIQQLSLACCGCEVKKNGSIELVITDKTGFDQLQAERQAIEGKLAALDRLVVDLDAIFLDAEAQGHPIYEKVPGAVNRAENKWRAQHRAEDPRPWDPTSRTVGIPNATLTGLLARCDEALEQARIAGWA